MKNLLIYLLLLTNIGASSAFAWDSHAAEKVSEDTVITDVSLIAVHHKDITSPTSELPHSDHCSHGAAHLVGIFADTAVTQHQALNRRYLPPSVLALPNLRIALMLRPPIV